MCRKMKSWTFCSCMDHYLLMNNMSYTSVYRSIKKSHKLLYRTQNEWRWSLWTFYSKYCLFQSAANKQDIKSTRYCCYDKYLTMYWWHISYLDVVAIMTRISLCTSTACRYTVTLIMAGTFHIEFQSGHVNDKTSEK
jgi:hypothetical protein